MLFDRWLGIVSGLTIGLFGAVSEAQGGTCSSTSPCVSGCCGNSGYCGFGPAYCGTGNCTSSCDAQAQCGEYAPAGQSACPLNVCCSQYGFCGTTSDFCGTGCQNGCAAVEKPSCGLGEQSSSTIRIGYYESWNLARPCDTVPPAAIIAEDWTHINYAFALIDSGTFKIAQMNDYDTQMYSEVTALKAQNPSLKVYISVGGWAAGGQIFSQMTSSAANRAAFIESALALMRTYAFDGIDIDWEYPVASDRGGNSADLENYPTFMSELQQALNGKYGLTATIPSSYWYMQGFDVVNLAKYVDWFNFMSYDIHGTWDGNNPYTQAVVQPHTNLTEIDQGLQLLWRNGISPRQVVLGLGFYGRSFTLSDPSCNEPMCPFSGGGTPGACTQTSGILSDDEIVSIISKYDLTPTLNAEAAIKYMSWDNNQWVSYDDQETINLKLAYADSLCLAGTMAWALDLDGSGTSSQAVSSRGYTSMDRVKISAYSKQATGQEGIFWTPCLSNSERQCPAGYQPGLQAFGKIFDSDLGASSAGCKGKNNRVICIPDSMQLDNCNWYRNSNGGKICDGRCPAGTFLLSQSSQPAGDRTACRGGSYVPICCTGWSINSNVCPVSSFSSALSGSLSFPNSPGLEYSSVIPDKTVDKRDVDSEAADVAENYTLPDSAATADDTLALPPVEVVPTKTLEKRQYVGNYQACATYDKPMPSGPGYVAVNVPMFGGLNYFGYTNLPLAAIPTPSLTTISTTVTYSETSVTSTRTGTCSGDRYPQPCLHYRSYISNNIGNNPITCLAADFQGAFGRNYYPNQYSNQHKPAWSSWIQKTYVNPSGVSTPLKAPRGCQADEWPPYAIWSGRPYASIRNLPGPQNGGVANNGGSKWSGLCRRAVRQSFLRHIGSSNYGLIVVESYAVTLTTLIAAYSMSFTNMPNYPYDGDGLNTNPCWPKTLGVPVEAGFALLLNDPYYPQGGPFEYALNVVPAGLTAGKTPPTKRGLYDLEQDRFILDDGNSTHILTAEDLAELDEGEELRLAVEHMKLELETAEAIEMQMEEEERHLAEILAAPPLITGEADANMVAATPPSGPRMLIEPVATPAASIT